MRKVEMYRVYPARRVKGWTNSYCWTFEEAEGEQARFEAWTGVKWKIEKVERDERVILNQ